MFIKDLSLHTLCESSTGREAAARWRFAKLGEEEAVISLYSIYWTEYALVFVLVMSFWLFMSLSSRWNVPLFLSFKSRPPHGQQGLDNLFISYKHNTICRGVRCVYNLMAPVCPFDGLLDFICISHTCLVMHVDTGYMP